MKIELVTLAAQNNWVLWAKGGELICYSDSSWKAYSATQAGVRWAGETSAVYPPVNWVEIILKSVLAGGTLYLAVKGVEAFFSEPPRHQSPKDTFRYILKDGRKTVQFGITNSPSVRCSQHISAGKQFSTMEIVESAVSRTTAREWEHTRIEAYRSRGGLRPKYNKAS